MFESDIIVSYKHTIHSYFRRVYPRRTRFGAVDAHGDCVGVAVTLALAGDGDALGAGVFDGDLDGIDEADGNDDGLAGMLDADGLTHGVALAESDAGTALTLGEATTAGDAAGEDDTDATGDTAGNEDAAGEAASDGDGTPLHTPYAV